MSKHLSDVRDSRMKEKLLSIADMCAAAIVFILRRYKNPHGVGEGKAYIVYKEDAIIGNKKVKLIMVERLYPRRWGEE